MTTLIGGYGQRLRHQHGWEVQLACAICGHRGLPNYEGRTPSSDVTFEDRPTVFANLTCYQCGQDLTQKASEKILELFSDVPSPTRNKLLLLTFIGLMVGLPMLLFLGVWEGIQLGWWGNIAYIAIAGLSLILFPVMFWFNLRLHDIRRRCQCGNPDYLFMGLLGRSSCYRCSSCGRLLRLRD